MVFKIVEPGIKEASRYVVRPRSFLAHPAGVCCHNMNLLLLLLSCIY